MTDKVLLRRVFASFQERHNICTTLQQLCFELKAKISISMLLTKHAHNDNVNMLLFLF